MKKTLFLVLALTGVVAFTQAMGSQEPKDSMQKDSTMKSDDSMMKTDDSMKKSDDSMMKTDDGMMKPTPTPMPGDKKKN